MIEPSFPPGAIGKNEGRQTSTDDAQLGQDEAMNSSAQDLARDFSFEFFGAVFTAVVGLLLGFTAFGGMFSDLYMSLSGPAEVSDEVTVLTIGPEALHMWNPEDANPEVTPRGMLAELVQALDEGGARTIVMDVMLDTPQKADGLLEEAARAHGAVIAAERAEVNQPQSSRKFAAGIVPSLSLPTLDGRAAAIQSAHANLFLEEPVLLTGQQIVRGVPPVLFYQRASLTGPGPTTSLGSQVLPPSHQPRSWHHP
jgi:hypothetical protein